MKIKAKSIQSEALGSRTRNGTTEVLTYTTELISGGSSTKALQMRAYFPNGIDAKIPRPCVLYLNHGLFSMSDVVDDAALQAIADLAVTSGIIFIAYESRILGDNPVTHSGRSSDGVVGAIDNISRTINAGVHDTLKAYQYVRNITSSNFAIEPNWIFLSGSSSGAIEQIMSVVYYDFDVAGLIINRAAFAADGVTDATTAIRTILNKDETDYLSSMPPVCLVANDADSVINSTHMSAFISQLDSGHSKNVTHNENTDNHKDWFDFDTAFLVAASTMGEAWKDFIDSLTSTITPQGSSINFV